MAASYRSSYMKFYRSVRSVSAPEEVKLAFSKSKTNRAATMELWQMFCQCDGDWSSSSLVLSAKSKNKQETRGRHAWPDVTNLQQQLPRCLIILS
jgi:hypothetical protein